MCGIAGFVQTAPSHDDGQRALQRMTDAIRHRGPDDSGFYNDPLAKLGHRRLSIIDVSGGHQPLANEDGSLWIVYNGEIFNHAELRPDLERAGHRFQTRCDTEMIVHAFEEYGPACLNRFRGMFAFALWNRETRTLFCARDRLGIKPFYYFWDGKVFAFASEIKALLEHPAITAELEEAVLPEYLNFGYVSEERTMFRGIRRLMPGHHLTLRAATSSSQRIEPRIEQYWNLPEPGAETGRLDNRDWIAETRRRLEETVRMRLMSDVPLGMFLSGGVDSSCIAALIKRMTQSPVKTFSVGYEEAQYSELGYAAEVARSIGTDHHEVVVGMDSFFNMLPKLIWHEDEPIAWPSSVSLYFVSKLAASQVKVVLTGEGADELFGGYVRYSWNLKNLAAAKAYGIVPEGLRRRVRERLATTALLGSDLRRKLGHTFLGRENTIESLYLDNFYSAFSLEEQNRLLSSSPQAVYGNYLRYWNERPHAAPLHRMLYADQKTYLAELLMKQDQMSMACSIESRVPFLDHQFVEFASRVPDNLKIQGNVQKYILKEAVADLLPPNIVHRKKMGFPTPIRKWLLDPRADTLFQAITARDGFLASYVDLKEVNRLLERHRADKEDATDRLWRLLNLQLWGDLFLTGKRDRWLDGVLPVEAVSPAV
ncbi:MAG: asparagine synthase (glutamine-hydrolyzing) [Acidobacteriota bacterium]|nr:asparagine synthase (glutamine-hydrolyzing) [Acidobacteriota bacterium]